jgi:D-alanyl-D-alanine carboxypeptidase
MDIVALGRFPEFPTASLPATTAAGLQAALDETVDGKALEGVTASVVVAGVGSWTGAAGSQDGEALVGDSHLPTHSAGKNIVAAEVLRLAEDGRLALDDLASEHLPRALRFFDANGATIRQVLAMRSGIPRLDEQGGYEVKYPAEQAATVEQVFRRLPAAKVRAGVETEYASTNFILLGAIIEHETGRTLAEALKSDVLDHPGLEGIVYPVTDALAADGWRVEATSPSLARWGYSLYGGTVISSTWLQEMIDFMGQWYGLGTMDFSSVYGTSAVGHDGESSPDTCCSEVRLVVLPEEGVVIAVQANTVGTGDPYREVERLTLALRNTVS